MLPFGLTLETLPGMIQTIIIALIILGVLLFVLVILFYIFAEVYKWKDREERALDFVLLQVAVPRENEIKIDVMEQMLSSLSSIRKGGGSIPFLSDFLLNFKPQPHVSFEIVAKKEDIRFYVSVHKKLRDLIEKEINGVYSGADIKEVEEYNIFSEDGFVASADLVLKGPDYYPIKVFKDLPSDPLSFLTSTLVKMGDGEGAAIQILISPADSNWRSLGKKYVSKSRSAEAEGDKKGFRLDPKTMEAIEAKCSKPGFNTSIRIVVSSTSLEMAKMHLDNIKGAFEQYASDYNKFTSRKWVINKAGFMMDFIYRYQPMFRKAPVLNSEELAAIYHFPNKTVETPHLFMLNAKRAPAPQQIPSEGLYLGKSVYRGIERRICMSDDDRRRHMYIIGKTGTGKSWFLRNMIMQDIRAGKGVCFIDPHDTYEQVLDLIPPERAEDVIYFNPGDQDRPMGLNVMEAYTEEQKHYVVTAIIGLFYKLYDPHQTGIVGPRLEHNIRNAMLTAMSVPGSTFIEVQRLMTDPSYVQELLPHVNDPMVRRYWTDQIAQTADFHKSEILDYIVSKFGRFTTNKLMRNMIGQSKSAFDFRKVMDEGKILIINLAKGIIGEENSNFLGLLLIPKLLTAAMSRQDIPEDQRRDFYLYVDEFQNFATPDFATILSEARKYKLNLVVANQFIGQMEEEVKNAVFGNVGTMVAFRVGVTDANFLQHYFKPAFNEADLINIEARNAYISTIVNNEAMPPFSMDTSQNVEEFRKQRNTQVRDMIVELSRLRYARDKGIVEREIAERSNL